MKAMAASSVIRRPSALFCAVVLFLSGSLPAICASAWGVAASTVTLAEALDNDTLAFTSGGDAPWFGQTEHSFYDGDAAQSGAFANGQTSWLETTVTGPGLLSFRWQRTNVFDTLRFLLDGAVTANMTWSYPWQLYTIPLKAGSHTLRWVHVNSTSGTDGPALLDKVVYTPSPLPTIGEAVDNTTLAWGAGGDPAWFVQTEVTLAGGWAARVGKPSGFTGQPWLETQVNGPGYLSFACLPANTGALGGLAFSVDSVLQSECWTAPPDSVSFRGWERQVHFIPSGSHTLRWRYTDSYEETCLDQVTYTPGPAIALGEALDAPALAWSTGGPAGWFGQAFISADGQDAGRSGYVLKDQTSWIETQVTGPGLLGFSWRTEGPFMFPEHIYSVDGVGKLIQRAGYRWESPVVRIATGGHVLRWSVTPDQPGQAGYLDRVAYIPGPAVLVTYPAGGETLRRREFATIRWIASEDVGQGRIELWRDGLLQHVIGQAQASDGAYEWVVPLWLPSGTGYQARVATDVGLVLAHAGDGLFSIAPEEPALRGYLRLPGADARAEVADDPILDVGDSPGEGLTAEAWVNFRQFSDATILDKGAYRLTTAKRYTYPNNFRCLMGRLQLTDGSAQFVEACLTSASGRGFWVAGWHHVALTLDRGTGEMALYLDGQRESTMALTGLVSNTADSLVLGRGVDGMLDEIRISDVARYSGTTYTPPAASPACDPHTRGLWRFDELEGATFFADACGAVGNWAAGYGGAQAEGLQGRHLFLPQIVR